MAGLTCAVIPLPLTIILLLGLLGRQPDHWGQTDLQRCILIICYRQAKNDGALALFTLSQVRIYYDIYIVYTQGQA
jgi:hypothetical protein